MSKLTRLTIALVLGLTMVLALTPMTGTSVVFAEDQPDGSTIVSPQTTDGTWGPGTITATADVVVNAGVVITIAPGTTVFVADGVGFTVNGDLHSDGPVTFTAISAVPGAWDGVTYADGSSGYLNETTIEYAVHALTLNTSSPITISNSHLRYNLHQTSGSALAYGAGLYIVQGDHLIENTYIYGNVATASGNGQVRGAGIYIVDGAPHVLNSWIYENTATGNRAGAGGGIGVLGGSALIESSHILTNTITGGGNGQLKSGAGIGFAGHTSVVIRDSWITANRNELSDGYAGGGGVGFGNQGSASLIENNVIYANYIQGPDWCEGGGIDTWDTTNSVIINNNLIISNTSGTCRSGYGAYGGGVNMNGSSTGVRVINNTIVGNQAGRGGGLYLQGGTVVALNNVIVNNSASIRGGGVRRDSGTVDYNDIFGNTAPTGPDTDGSGFGSHNLSIDPLFLGTGDLVQQYHLSQWSTLINAGTNTGTGLPNDDYDGDPRPLYGDWDIGFDEVAPTLAVIKSADSGLVEAGEMLHYTIVIFNSGQGDATGVTISDTLPANTTWADNLTITPTSAGGIAGTPPEIASGITVAAGSIVTITFDVNVDDPLSVGVDDIANIATVTCEQGAEFSVTDGVTTPVDAAPDLALDKDDDGIATSPGGVVVYTLSYANDGTQGATGVVITETVPAHTTFDAASSTPGWSCADGSPASTVCIFSVGPLGAGEGGAVDFAVTVDDSLPAGVEEIDNIASIADDGTNGTDLTPGDNSDDDTTPVDAAPDLTLDKDDGGVTATPGSVVTYTLSYANNGTQGATGVILTETVPANTTFDAASSTGVWGCADGSPAGTVCTLSIDSLDAGDGGTVDFAVTVSDPLPAGVEEVDNAASIADDGANGTDLTPGDNSDSDTTPVDAAPDLALDKDDDGIAITPGGVVVYALSYANDGTQGAIGVVITETVPAHTTFDAASSTPGWSCADGSPASTVCVFSVGPLGAGEGGAVDFAVTVDGSLPAGVEEIDNIASIADDGTNGTDLTPGDNSDDDTTPVVDAAPDLVVTKSDGDITTVPGDVVVYSLGYTNDGNQNTTGVVITETVPDHTTFNAVSSSLGWSCADGSPAGTLCTFSVGDLNAGGGGSVAFAVTVDDPLPGGVDYISNTASIADDGTNGVDLNPNDNQDDDITAIEYSPVLDIVKTGPDVANVEERVVYTFTVSHAPTSDGSPVSDITVSDDVAGLVTLIGGDEGDDGLLEAGETWVFTASHTIQDSDPNPLVNTGTVEGQDRRGDTVVASDTHSTAIGQAAPQGYRIFLPIVLRRQVTPAPAPGAMPDLVVESIIVAGSDVQVVIKNQGNAPVTNVFWVDLYVDPSPVPTGVNQTWSDGRSPQGIVWGVAGGVLPLDPGESITLTYGDIYYWPSLSNISLPLSEGTPIYVQVDSANTDTTYGAVLEDHEDAGGVYNNIGGPVSATLDATGEIKVPVTPDHPFTASGQFPPRP